jgi:manganese efflux pump family protein
MLALLLVAASVGMSNFAAAVSLGVAGVDARTRLRVGLVFGAFESGMPVVGLLIGDNVAGQLGHASRWIGGALLIGVGLYALLSSLRAHAAAGEPLLEAASAPPADAVPASAADSTVTDPTAASPTAASPTADAPVGKSGRRYAAGSNVRLLISGLALSLDNLVVGFALGTYQIEILVGAVVIGAVSVVLSLVGLELGARLGNLAGRHGDQLGGLILVAVGAAVASGALA